MASACTWHTNPNYRQTSYIRRTLIGNKIVDHSDLIGVAPIGALHLHLDMVSLDWAKSPGRRDVKHLSFGIWCALYYRFDGNQTQATTVLPTKLCGYWFADPPVPTAMGHCNRDEMAKISNAFSWMKTLEFPLKRHRIFFLIAKLTINQHWFE